MPQVSYVDPQSGLASGTGGPQSNIPGQVIEPVWRKSTVHLVRRLLRKMAGEGSQGVAVPVLPSAPAADAAGNTPGELNAVVVGLNPGNQLPSLPPVSRPADFSAGPKLNPKGGAGEGDSAAISVPDLTIRSGNIDTRSTIMARNTVPKPLAPSNPTSTAGGGQVHYRRRNRARPSATRVSNAPDPRFDGRTVYMMAIQMPNITSYVGSWLMWYSERNRRGPFLPQCISPPGVHRKVDPKYVAEAVSERVEGTVRLTAVIRKDGTVGSVELVRGLDARLDRTAQEALAKWQFSPAMRNGEPIDVDILVEIPFRLAAACRNMKFREPQHLIFDADDTLVGEQHLLRGCLRPLLRIPESFAADSGSNSRVAGRDRNRQ